MEAIDYLSGVYLDNHKFSKDDVIRLMEDYHKYKSEYNNQLIKDVITRHAELLSMFNENQKAHNEFVTYIFNKLINPTKE